MVIKSKEELQSFAFYETFFFTIQRIKNPEERCKAYDILVEYWLYWTLPDTIDSEWTQQLMENAVPLIDSAKKRRTASIENWKKWWAPKWNQNAVKDWDSIWKQPRNNLETTQKQPKNNLNVNVNVNDNVNDNDNINNKEKEIKEKEKKDQLMQMIRNAL